MVSEEFKKHEQDFKEHKQEFREHKSHTENRLDRHETRMDKADARQEKTDEKIGSIKETQTVQGERLNNIEKSLDAIHDDTRWLRRTFTGGAITALITGLGSLVFFSIKLGGG